MDEEAEFRGWVYKNRMHFIFGQYSPVEVGALARLVGFDVGVICRVLSRFEEALAGVDHAKKRQNKQWNAFLVAVQQKVDLTDQWQALGAQLLHGADWGDQ